MKQLLLKNLHQQLIGIISKSMTNQRLPVEIAGFDVLKCRKIRAYAISHINDLVSRNIDLTPNQSYIYTKKKQLNSIYNSIRIPLMSFENNH